MHDRKLARRARLLSRVVGSLMYLSSIGLLCIFAIFIASPSHAAVTLVAFTATASPSGVTLEWSTESEIDNEGFLLRRSTDPDAIMGVVVVSSFIPVEGLRGRRG